MTVTFEQIVALPKVLLHDHLDGGVRPQTVVELAAKVGHELPAPDPEALAAWFRDAADSGSLETYIATFSHTLAVMQRPKALRRVAREAVLDLAADGVVYVEERFAPELHQSGGLSLQQAVDAVLEGLSEGEAEAAEQGRTIRARLLLCAMRQSDRADEVAALALANRDRGVVGFDIAGPEAGFPASALGAAFAQLRTARFPVTVHAGEAAGRDSLDEAVDVGALRLGHGVRLVDDIHVAEDPEHGPTHRLGRLAHWVRDRGIALEVCPTSNLQTGAAVSIATHPVTTLLRLGFAVTVNTDNRLQSRTSLSRELHLLVTEAGWTLDDVRTVTVTAARHAFVHADERQDLIDRVILPGHAPTGTGRHRA
ncbi:adenosine deaminase [Cellulomonas pakistanensis]|uniref:adenosine deaminase n=1 Tax=Cellulomonas pakistanensis TaxID=992287 RepID=A0A919U2R4_9CELL|nr:adenosine deaminase [Cellulomonas pakistanensis]GIG36368.1 adenosine deaminase 2 [Cellulomonas pakistanensis]